MRSVLVNLASLLVLASAGTSHAVSIVIGDVDGFGFSNPNSYTSAQGTLPDSNSNGLIEPGEYLPDLDGDGYVRIQGRDEFDNREATELAATNGAQFTDVSLENGYAGFGTAPANDVLFTFSFLAPEVGDADYGVDHFINLVFGDYDVTPAYLYVDGVQVNLTRQNSSEDGLVQLAFANVAWNYLTDGEVVIDMYAPNEPYVAIDYAFLHTENTAAPVPAPGVLGLMVLALGGLLVARRR